MGSNYTDYLINVDGVCSYMTKRDAFTTASILSDDAERLGVAAYICITYRGTVVYHYSRGPIAARA